MPPNPNRIILAADSHALNHFMECDRKYALANLQHLRILKPNVEATYEPGNPRPAKLHSVEKHGAKELGTFIHDILFRINRFRVRKLKNKIPFNYPVTDATLLQIGLKRIKRRHEFEQKDVLFHQTKFMEFYSMLVNNYAWLKPVGYEVGFSKVIYEDRQVCFIYEGRVDHIAELETGLAWVDYKSQSRETQLYENTNQFLGYSWVLGTNLGFVQYYGLQKEKKKEESFRLKTINHPQGLIDQWRFETIRQFRKIASLISFGENAFERNRSSCNTGKYGDCQFTRICDNASAPPAVIEGIKRTFYKIEPWHAFRPTSNGESE